VSGKVRDVDGVCPIIAFDVEDYRIYTTVLTRFDDGRCRDLKKNRRVEVKGRLMFDGRVLASEVEIDR
jgi:hypothetical protein